MGRDELRLAAAELSARRYAQHLLGILGVAPQRPLEISDEHPALSWARCGLMALTGHPGGAALMCPTPLAACADGALAALASLAPTATLRQLRGSQLLAERAAITGYSRQGAVSPGGSCHLLEAADGGLALNLARDDDWALLPAWLESAVTPDWAGIALAVAARPVDQLMERGRLLGLALAPMRAPPASSPGFLTPGGMPPKRPVRHRHPPRVLELASLWAGPLCGHLLKLCGAEVIKVESLSRPDGARRGATPFFDLLNGGKRSVALDLTSPDGCGQLRALICGADIVIEGSRPRALRQLGFHAETLVTENPGLTWLSINGHGRGEPQENWVAYGDDAAVDAGLSQLLFEASGERVICGDAIADPLTGIHAALAAWAGHLQGGGGLVDLALSQVVSQCIRFDLPATTAALRDRQQQWTSLLWGNGLQPLAPRARPVTTAAPALGADTVAVLTTPGFRSS